MMKIILDNKFKNYLLNKDEDIEFTYCNKDNILDLVNNNNFDGFFLSQEYNNILYDVRRANHHQEAFIVTIDNSKEFCTIIDYCLEDKLSQKSFNKAIKTLIEMIKPDPRKKYITL